MLSEQEALARSHTFWLEEARSEKIHSITSFVMAATGAGLVAHGVVSLFKGEVTDAITSIGIGSILAVPTGKLGLSEVKVYKLAEKKAQEAQNKLDYLQYHQKYLRNYN